MSWWMRVTATALAALTSRLKDAMARSEGVAMEETAPAAGSEAAVHADIGAGREALVGMIGDMSQLTERNIMVAGECIGAIVSETQRYVADVKTTLAAFEAGRGGGVAGAIDGQRDAIDAYLGDLLADFHRQQQITVQAIALCGRISLAAARVNRLAGASKLLSLNTSINANRLGGGGRALGVIAHEMQLTSDRVRGINERIGATADDLVRAIEETVAQSARLEALARTLATDIQALSEEIGEGSQTLEAHIRQAGEVSDRRLSELLALSMAALSHLQFQDPMVQSIQQLDPMLAAAHERIAAQLGLDARCAPLRYTSNLGSFDDGRAAAAPAAVDDFLFGD